MTGKLIYCRKVGNELTIRAHLDITRIVEGGTPDPAWVFESAFGISVAFTEARAIAEFKRLCRARVNELSAPTASATASEGEEFTV